MIRSEKIASENGVANFRCFSVSFTYLYIDNGTDDLGHDTSLNGGRRCI